MERLKRGLLIVLAAVVVAGAGLAVRYWLADWTQHQLCAQHIRRIAALDEPQAARAVRELVALDEDAPQILVPLLAEEREAVALAAAEALDRLVADWSRLRTPAASPRIAALARELAAMTPQLPPPGRRAAHNLATRLVVWPLDPLTASRGQVVADCEVVLRLPLEPRGEARIAAAPTRDEPQSPEISDPQPLAAELPSPLPAAVDRPIDPAAPRVFGPVEPERLIDASEERPIRPKQFLPPRAMKIEG